MTFTKIYKLPNFTFTNAESDSWNFKDSSLQVTIYGKYGWKLKITSGNMTLNRQNYVEEGLYWLNTYIRAAEANHNFCEQFEKC